MRTVIATAALTVLLPACERIEPEVYDEQNWQGTIDPNLPDALQAKQDAIIRLFIAIQEVGIDNVGDQAPDIRFGESFDEFFEDAVDLHRWDWDGPPSKDELSVRLVLRKDEPGLPEIEKRRKYTVRQSGDGFVIVRSKNDVR